MSVPTLIGWAKEDLGSPNAAVRTAATQLLATMHRQLGAGLGDLVRPDVKPALWTGIEEAFKANPQSPSQVGDLLACLNVPLKQLGPDGSSGCHVCASPAAACSSTSAAVHATCASRRAQLQPNEHASAAAGAHQESAQCSGAGWCSVWHRRDGDCGACGPLRSAAPFRHQQPDHRCRPGQGCAELVSDAGRACAEEAGWKATSIHCWQSLQL